MRKNKINSLKQFYLDNKNAINLILIIFLVGIFAFFAWKLENRVFALFIVLFFIVALVFRQKHYFVLIIAPIILFILFNTQTLNALIILTKSDLTSIQHPKAEITTLFTPNSGQGVLPQQVLTMISILKENNIENYKLSEKFSNDVVIYQRIVEGAWPIKLETNSTYILIATDEINDYKECLPIEEKEDVILVNCH